MTNNNNHKRLILFDIDGTLLNTQGAGRSSTRDAMLEIFGTCSTIDAHVFGGKTDWYTLLELLADHGHDEESIGQRMAEYEQALARHLTRLLDGNGSSASPCSGALEVVQTLLEDDTAMLGIVTGNCASSAPLKLSAAGFDPAWFPIGAYGSEAINRDDLSALALERAVQHWGHEITPEAVIVVGDTPADVACARALGAVAVAVTTGHARIEDLIASKPDHLIDDLTGLLDRVIMPLREDRSSLEQ